MRDAFHLCAIVVAGMVLVGCSSHEAGDVQKPAALPPHSTAHAVDWSGTYEGTVPCADCEGIRTLLTLNEDLTYRLSQTYLGKGGDPVVQTGTFEWNAEGSTISLSGIKGGPNKYFVGEGTVAQLDMSGNRITGDLGPMYLLRKKGASGGTGELTGTTWVLKEIMGTQLTLQAGQQKRPFMVLWADGDRFSGFAGCNNFTGTYEVKEGNRLSFSKVVMTQMACPDMEIETKFMQALGSVDNYAINGNRLSLHKAKTAPLAVFEIAVLE